MSRGRIEEAISQYERVLADSPNDTGLSNLIGDLYSRLRRHDEAITHYQRAARVFATEGFYVKAIALYKKIHRLDPTRLDVFEKLADLYGQQGLLKEAVSQYQALADYYTQHENSKEAVKVYSRLAELEPRELAHRAKLAELYQEREQFDLMGHEYCEIARHMLGGDRVDEAMKILRHGLDLNLANESFVQECVALLQAAGRADLASSFAEEAEGRNPRLGDTGVLPQFDSALEAASDLPSSGSEVAGESGSPPQPVASAPTVLPAGSSQVTRSARRLGPPPTVGAIEELLAEAEVFVKYGLKEKALDRLHEVLQVSPQNLSAHNQLISLLLEQGRLDEVVTRATAMEAVATSMSDPRLWMETRDRLETAGFTFSGTQISGLPPTESSGLPPTESSDAASGASEEIPDAAVPTGIQAGDAEALESSTEVLPPSEYEEAVPVLDPDPAFVFGDLNDAPAPVDLEKSQVLMEVSGPDLEGDSFGSTEADASDFGALIGAGSSSILEGPEELPSLEQPLADPGPEIAAASDLPGANRSEFVDMASELLGELEGDVTQVDPPVREAEQSLQEIVADLRVAVSETLSDEDSETHYNLAIAYREMGLLDEAIGEFQTVARDPVYRIQCCSLLGQCLREKGLAEQAIKWLRRGLEAPQVSEDQGLSFLYDIGECQADMGDSDAARETFSEIHGINSNYRDIVAWVTEFNR